ADSGTLFQRAYCQESLCHPSRTSVLTGCRPPTTRVFNLKTDFRQALPDIATLPQTFKAAGYATRALGKVHHGPGRLDDAASWSEPCWRPEKQFYHTEEGHALETELDKEAEARGVFRFRPGPAFEAPQIDDGETMDGQIATKAIEIMEGAGDQPFFLAVGFRKPHLPFVAPKRYWDLYDMEEIPALGHNQMPEGSAPWARTTWSELRSYMDVPDEGPLDEALAAKLHQGYLACVSYMDALVGQLMATLERLDLRENTIVCLWGDHGFHLGDNSLWCKLTNYEAAVRVPLIISAPGGYPRNTRSPRLVELVDLYPTLCELAGLPIPEYCEGLSMVPLLSDPALPWKPAAFSQIPVNDPERGRGLGRTLCNERYRLLEWRFDDTKGPVAFELYDYQADPQGKRNVAGEPSYATALQTMRDLLGRGWRGARQRL
ncbi:MAG: sulfatase, partial [Planctomycetota bacterium]|nr:sulfatase [Planctomycetota bacterium]